MKSGGVKGVVERPSDGYSLPGEVMVQEVWGSKNGSGGGGVDGVVVV